MGPLGCKTSEPGPKTSKPSSQTPKPSRTPRTRVSKRRTPRGSLWSLWGHLGPLGCRTSEPGPKTMKPSPKMENLPKPRSLGGPRGPKGPLAPKGPEGPFGPARLARAFNKSTTPIESRSDIARNSFGRVWGRRHLRGALLNRFQKGAETRISESRKNDNTTAF